MAWFSRFTRFGDMHWVFGQEQQVSCGVACVIMAAFKVNKLRPGVKAFFDESTILSKAVSLFGPNPLGAEGLNNPQMLQLLNHPDLKMPGWSFRRLPRASVAQTIVNRVGVTQGVGPTLSMTPMIVGVDWRGGGGHWVLVDTVRELNGQKYATVCDPWDANVHVTPLSATRDFAYTGRQAQAVDLWGKRFEYTTPSVGSAFLGDVLYRT